jgi:chromosome segregation ATPase
MIETVMLSDLEAKMRQLENDLASLCSREFEITSDIQNLEEAIIAHLKEKIMAKKRTLSGLEAQKCDLEKKLADLKTDELSIQKSEETYSRSDDVTIVSVVENVPERIAEDKKRKTHFF